MLLKVILLFITSFAINLTNGSVSIHNPFYCYAEDVVRPQITMFSVFTAYEAVRGKNVDPNVSSCTPSKFWMISRHGARFPSVSSLGPIFEHSERLHRDTVKNYDSGRTSLCASDIDLIRNWKFDPNITFENEEHLTVSGWNEMRDIAERFQSIYPSVLPSTYSRNDYLFRSTDTQRTIGSLRAIADGLFGYNGYQQVEFEDFDDPDIFLRPYLFCALYNDIPGIMREQDAFEEGPEYQEMIVQVSRKLGFDGSHVLRAHEVRTLSTICEYEQMWDLNGTSPLCGAFSVANYQVMEYWNDLYFYYRWGYGVRNYLRLYENVPCLIMQDMLTFLLSNDPNDHKARFFNTHYSTMSLTLISLGAFEDDGFSLNRHNFAQQTFRIFKTSINMPMAANLAVIRYDCSDGDNDVLFLLNEKPLQLPGCQSNGLCKMSSLLARLNRFLDANCMEMFCTNS